MNRAPMTREIEGDPVVRQDVEMLVETFVESPSLKSGSDAVADDEERARLRLRAEGKRGLKHDMPRRGQKRKSTQPLPEEVTSTVLVVSGSKNSLVPIDEVSKRNFCGIHVANQQQTS